jgi:trafficking protein particle complex subunit 9
VLTDALISPNLAEEEIVEIEHFLYNRPAFVWNSANQSHDTKGFDGSNKITVEAHGKRGLAHGIVHVVYAFVDEAIQPNQLYCRQLDFRLSVTVNASLELLACDFLPVNSTSKDSVGQYLLVLEVRNSWINPMLLSLTHNNPEGTSQTTSTMFQSGQTQRIVLRLPRMTISAEKLMEPLPRRGAERQYIASTSNAWSAIIAAREAWWYRQNLLDTLEGQWTEHGGGTRKGEFELRGLRLSETHLGVVRSRLADASIIVESVNDSVTSSCRRLLVTVRNNEGKFPY